MATDYLEALGAALDAHITTRLTAISGFPIANYDVRTDWPAGTPAAKDAIVILVGDEATVTPHAPMQRRTENLVRLGRWSVPVQVSVVVDVTRRNQFGIIANHVRDTLWSGSLYDGALTLTLSTYYNAKVRLTPAGPRRGLMDSQLGGRLVYTFDCTAYGEVLASLAFPTPTAYTLNGNLSSDVEL